MVSLLPVHERSSFHIRVVAFAIRNGTGPVQRMPEFGAGRRFILCFLLSSEV